MSQIVISISVIILVLIIVKIMIKTGESVFSPTNESIEFKLNNNNILITSHNFSGTYELLIPNDIIINETDKVSISYSFNRGNLTGINELYINDILFLNKDNYNFILKMIL